MPGGRYTADSKDKVRDAVDFIDLVSAKTDLRRSGANEFTGLCPFHEERSPSFHVNSVDKVYYCFGCQAAGDVFNYVMETEGFDFPAALEFLADRYGVVLEREEEDPQAAARRERRERLLSLLDRTASYYERCLWDSEEAEHAREYLKERQLDEEVLKQFRVGYSPSVWDRVLIGSRQNGFTEEELLAAGLAQRSRDRGGVFDRFRARLMFPLADFRGRVIGFGARALRENQQPKYLNSSEGEAYHKGGNIYGAHLARATAAKQEVVTLVEGYTDVIAMHQAGFTNAVGLMGTALTEEQIVELARMAPRVDLMLDADSAGQAAMLKAAKVASSRKLELRVVKMSAGSDPAEMIQEEGGVGRVSELLSSAVPFVRFRVEQLLRTADISDTAAQDHLIEDLRGVIGGVPPSALREELIHLVSERLALSTELTQALISGAPRSQASPSLDKQPSTRSPLEARSELERTFLALCIAKPTEGEKALEKIDPRRHLTVPLLQNTAEQLKSRLADPLTVAADSDEDVATLIAELVVRSKRPEIAGGSIDVTLLQLEMARLEREIQHATAAGDGEVYKLGERREQLLEQLRGALG